MKFLPYDRFTIQTETSAEDAMYALKSETEIQQRFSATNMNILGSNRKTFAGIFEGNTFRLFRVTVGRSAYLPEISGEIENGENDKASVYVKTNISTSTAVFSAAAILFSLYKVLEYFLGSSQSEAQYGVMVMWLSILIFTYGFMMLKYKSEYKKTRELLNTIFKKQ